MENSCIFIHFFCIYSDSLLFLRLQGILLHIFIRFYVLSDGGWVPGAGQCRLVLVPGLVVPCLVCLLLYDMVVSRSRSQDQGIR